MIKLVREGYRVFIADTTKPPRECLRGLGVGKLYYKDLSVCVAIDKSISDTDSPIHKVWYISLIGNGILFDVSASVLIYKVKNESFKNGEICTTVPVSSFPFNILCCSIALSTTLSFAEVTTPVVNTTSANT